MNSYVKPGNGRFYVNYTIKQNIVKKGYFSICYLHFISGFDVNILFDIFQ